MGWGEVLGGGGSKFGSKGVGIGVFLQKKNYVNWFEAVSFNSKNMSMKTL